MSDPGPVNQSPVRVECIIPILSVNSLADSVRFYVDVLGFHVDWTTSGMGSVSRDGHAIMFCQGGQGHPGTWIWIGVDDIEPLFNECAAKGVKITQKPTNFRWAYEMRIEDPDGHVLRLGSEPKPGVPFA